MSLGNVEYYTGSEINTDAKAVAEYDSAKLQAEAGIEQMLEIVAKRNSALKGWKLVLIRKSLKAAWKLVHGC